MEATQSSPMEQKIQRELELYREKWESSNNRGKRQTEVFRENVPLDECDFNEKFKECNLDQFFTHPEKIVLPVFNGYNSVHLYRDSKKKQTIPLFDDGNYFLVGALGEPGRDLPRNHKSKASHLMVIKHGDEGPITFNEMLPTDKEETEDLQERINFANMAVGHIRNNTPVAQCGTKVVEKANEMEIDVQTGIRQFMGQVISSFTEEFRVGRPGYTLRDETNTNIAGETLDVIQSLIDQVFTDQSLKVHAFIQPPHENSQVLSHIHVFLLHEPQWLDGAEENYYDCNTILRLKKEMAEEVEEVEEGEPGLTRTFSVRN